MTIVPKLYFRLLLPGDNIESWKKREFTSFHRGETPAEWMNTLENSKNGREDYPLKTSNGYYLPSARDAYFKHCVEDGKDWDSLDDKTKKSMTELCGVCAFDNPAGAFWYGGIKPMPSDRLVAFFGIELFKLGSEHNGGVLAVVIKPVGRLMTARQFVKQYCGGIEPQKPEGLAEDIDKEPQLSDEGIVNDEDLPDIFTIKSDSGGY